MDKKVENALLISKIYKSVSRVKILSFGRRLRDGVYEAELEFSCGDAKLRCNSLVVKYNNGWKTIGGKRASLGIFENEDEEK